MREETRPGRSNASAMLKEGPDYVWHRVPEVLATLACGDEGVLRTYL